MAGAVAKTLRAVFLQQPLPLCLVIYLPFLLFYTEVTHAAHKAFGLIF